VRLVPSPLSLTRGGLQKLAGEFAKFGTVGVVNTVLNYAVFNALILTVFAQGQLKANVIATVIATTASYFMNRHWTYRDRPKSALRREYTLFFVFNLAGLVIELGVLATAKYGLGLTSLLALNIAKTFGLGLGTIFRFWAYRTFVFPLATPAAAVAVPGQPVAVEPAVQPAVEHGFDEITAPLEAEWVDVELEAELRSAASRAQRAGS